MDKELFELQEMSNDLDYLLDKFIKLVDRDVWNNGPCFRVILDIWETVAVFDATIESFDNEVNDEV